VRRGVGRGECMQQRLSSVVWIDRGQGAGGCGAWVVVGLWQSQGLWVASRGFCSSCEMRVGTVGARCVRAASPTHALEHEVLSRSPSAAERRSPTSCNANSKSVYSKSICLSVCLTFLSSE